MNFGLGDFELTLNFLRNVSGNSKGLSETLKRLSSGVKVGSALDEGGSAIVQLSGAYQRDSKVLSQAASNVNLGLSQLSHAESALAEAENTLRRMDELAAAVESGASGDTLTAIKNEFNNLKSAYNNIINNTQLPSGSATEAQNVFSATGNHELSTQAGYTADSTIEYTVGELLDATVTITTTGSTTTVGDGTFTIGSSGSFGLGSGLGAVASGDFNEDGNIDIIAGINLVGMPGIDEGLFYLSGNGNGTFNYRVTVPHQSRTGGNGVISLQAVDLNNDDNLDILIGTDGSASAVVYGNGNGTFTVAQPLDIAGTSIQATDVNGDGIEDLVAYDSGGMSYSVSIGNGNGTFNLQTQHMLSSNFMANSRQAIAVGTLDSGSAVDLALATQNGILISTGNNNGTFNAGVTLGSTTDNYSGIRIADVDGDGNNDVIAVNQTQTRLEVYLGNGNGTFDAAKTFADASTMAFNDTYFQLVDIDGDDDLDIIFQRSNIYTLTNDGTGGFGNKTVITTKAQLNNTAIDDFNNDGLANDFFSQSGTTTYTVFTANTTEIVVPSSSTTSTQRVFDNDDNVDSISNATDARTTISSLLTAVQNEQGNVSAIQSRLTSAASLLSQTSQDFQAASERITNIDTAVELADFLAKSIISSSQISIAAQVSRLNLSAIDLLKDSFK